MISLIYAETGNYIVEKLEDFKPSFKRRIFELGIFSGVKLTLIQKSILKKVVLLSVNNYTLSLRADLAKFIFVRKL